MLLTYTRMSLGYQASHTVGFPPGQAWVRQNKIVESRKDRLHITLILAPVVSVEAQSHRRTSKVGPQKVLHKAKLRNQRWKPSVPTGC